MQAQKYSIREWPSEERPREKLLSKNPMSLTDAELLAILINNGTRDRSALDLARELLALGKHNLLELGKLSIKDYTRVHGIGLAKAITLSAALELGRRRHATANLAKVQVKGSHDIAEYLKTTLQDHKTESFAVVFLNRACKINHVEIVSHGGITGTVADPRIILKRALEENAVNIILCHNHPSGNLKPSKSDEDLTIKIKTAAAFFDIRVIDHIIVSEEGYFSFADEGLI